MSSTTGKGASAHDAGKNQVSTAEFVLTAAVLAVGNSTSATGACKEGEAMIAEQLTELLQDKAMVVDELNHLYCYRFGSTINDALKRFGFEGRIQDYFVDHKRFSINDGFVSVIAEPVVHEETPISAEEQTLLEDCDKLAEVEIASIAATESTAEIDSDFSDTESDVDITGWQSVGTRLADALEPDVDVMGWQSLGVRLADVLSPETDGCASNVDVSAWQSVGCRVADVLAPPDDGDVAKIDVRDWQTVGNRLLAALASERGVSDDIDVAAWRAPACRVAAGRRAADDEGGDVAEIDVIGWHTVGTRLLAAFDSEGGPSGDAGTEPLNAATTSLGVCRQKDSDAVDDIDAAGWSAVGTRVLCQLNAADDDGL